MTEARIARTRNRLPERIRVSVACVLANITRYLYDRKPVVSITDTLPTPCVRQDVERLVACTYARELRCQGDKQKECSDAYISDRTFKFFQGAVRAGVFEPAIRHGEALNRGSIQGLMRDLEQRDPSRWLAGRPEVPQKAHMGITTDDVERMLESSRACGPKYEAIMLILCTLGLRVNAIANLRLSTVWDAKSDSVRTDWRVLEKNSVIRRVTPCKDLCAAVTRYVKDVYDRRCVYLFGSPHNPQRWPHHVTSSVMRAICKRAQLPPVNPHRFRSYIVYVFIKNKNSLDQAAKFLGHKSSNITYKHYWHPDAAELAKGLDFFVDSTDHRDPHMDAAARSSETSMVSALEFQMTRCKQLEQENAALRRHIAQLENREDEMDGHDESTTSGEAPLDPLVGFD